MGNDRYPSIESLIIHAWISRLINMLTFPSRVISGLSSLVSKGYNEASGTMVFYLTRGTMYDMESHLDH
jgi:hypothetical protein